MDGLDIGGSVDEDVGVDGKSPPMVKIRSSHFGSCAILKLWRPFDPSATSSRCRRPTGADGRSEALAGTRLLRSPLNGLEMVELPAGPASGTRDKHGDGSSMLTSALRHITYQKKRWCFYHGVDENYSCNAPCKINTLHSHLWKRHSYLQQRHSLLFLTQSFVKTASVILQVWRTLISQVHCTSIVYMNV